MAVSSHCRHIDLTSSFSVAVLCPRSIRTSTTTFLPDTRCSIQTRSGSFSYKVGALVFPDAGPEAREASVIV